MMFLNTLHSLCVKRVLRLSGIYSEDGSHPVGRYQRATASESLKIGRLAPKYKSCGRAYAPPTGVW